MGRGNAANESDNPVDVAEDVRLTRKQQRGDGNGRGRSAAGEVFDRGTYEEDDPVTWEILFSPQEKTANGEPQPISDGGAFARARVVSAKKKPSSWR